MKTLQCCCFLFLSVFPIAHAFPQQPIPGEIYIGPADQSIIYYTDFMLEWYYDKEYTSYDLYFGTTASPPLFRAGLQPDIDGPINSTEYLFRSNWYDDNVNYPGAIYLNDALLNYSTTYYWRLTTTDENGTALSSPVYAFTTPRPNTLPIAPTLLYPADRAANVSHTLTLQWQGQMIDADGDEVSYDVYLKRGDNGTAVRIATGVKATSYTIPYDLDDQAGYGWYVIAIDGYSGQGVMHGNNQQVWSFTVENYKNDTPQPVSLVAPTAGAINTGTTVEFRWTNAVDKDLDPISYYLYAGTDPDPTTLVDIITGTNRYTWHAADAFQTYYWRVFAYDGKAFSISSAINAFTPTALSVSSPADGATNVGKRPVLTWSNSTELVYDVYLDKHNNPTTLITSGLKTGTFSPVLDDPRDTYYWKVIARTAQGSTTESSIRSFTPWTKQPGSSKPEMITVTGGTFNMGFAEYEMIFPGFETFGLLPTWPTSPQHQVFLDDYTISPYEVTYTQFLAFLQATATDWHVNGETIVYDHPIVARWSNGTPVVNANPVVCYIKTSTDPFDFMKHPKWLWNGSSLQIKPGFEDHPASWITPEGAALYADWAGGRLPTEAEWEYAAQGGKNASSYTYSGSNNIRTCAWYLFGDTNPANPMTGTGNGNPAANNKGTNPVGSKLANALGLYDMTGNVEEYCSDNYDELYYSQTDRFNPIGPLTGPALARGGAFDDIEANSMIKSSRKEISSFYNYREYGVRLAGTDETSKTVLVQGIITDQNNQPLAGMELTNGINKAVTNKFGAYQIRVKRGTPVHIVPTHPDHNFSPAFIDAGIAVATIANINFKAYWNEDYEIKGKVVDQNGNGVAGVSISTSSGTKATNAQGVFSLRVPAGHDYILKAAKQGYRMSQEEITITNVQNDVTDVIFTTTSVSVVNISGRVMRQGTSFGESGLLMAGLPDPVRTNGEGYYYAQVTAGWSGTISPIEDSYYSFGYATPTSAILTNVQMATTLDFTFLPTTAIMLTGTVVDNRGNPLMGVEITGVQDKPVTTDVAGVFGIRVAKGWKGTLSAQHTGYTFTPETLNVEVATSGTISTTPHFVAIPPGDYLLHGTVTDDLGLALQGATITGFGQTVSTDLNGAYSIWGKKHASGSLEPSMFGYAFHPQQVMINDVNSDQQQNFIVKPAKSFLVSGHIVDQEGQPLKNVILHGFGATVLTDANGNYSVYVTQGWSGIISPELNNYEFTPENFPISPLWEDIVIDFAGTGVFTSTTPTQDYDLILYPNPSAGKVTMSLPAPGYVQIITRDGRLIWAGHVNQTETIALQNSGLYLVKIFSGGKVYTSKLVIL